MYVIAGRLHTRQLETKPHTTLSRNARNRHSLANGARAVVETLHCHSSWPVGRRFFQPYVLHVASGRFEIRQLFRSDLRPPELQSWRFANSSCPVCTHTHSFVFDALGYSHLHQKTPFAARDQWPTCSSIMCFALVLLSSWRSA